MSAYKIAIVEDETAPASGSAVIRIDGLTDWPDDATLRILPIDDTSVPPESEGWPWGELKPQRVVPTDTGVEITVGPNVVNSARLLPGTPVTIQIGAAHFEAEARWPAIAPAVRRRSSTVAMSASQLLAARAEREKAEKDAAARRQELAEFAARSAREAAAEAEQPRTQPTAAALRTSDSRQLARLLPMRRNPSRPIEAVTGTPVLPGPAPSLGSLAKTAANSVVTLPVQPRDAPANRKVLLRGFMGGVAAMAALGAAFLTLAPRTWLPGAGGSLGGNGPAQIQVADLQSVFKDLGGVGALSPRKKSAANVDIATALSLADHNLHGQRTPAEREEAEFWLKRALASSMGGNDIGWALTQLGTIYAQSDSKQHSYAKAHTLWELAAAQGDPVAHCFLGALYEHGLGVPVNRRAAREHYQTADTLGACRSAKDAVARLKD